MSKRFVVSMAVDGRIDVEVDASTPQEAFVLAYQAFASSDLSRIEVVGAKPVSAYDNKTKKLTDYQG